jgi:putative PIG3 family NAD(P)H quinone oxidoreductase
VHVAAVTRPGTPAELGIREVPEPVHGADGLLVDVVAAGVNRADLLQAAGHYAPPAGAPEWPGLEVSGTVRQVGADVAGWRVGDRLAALLPGGGYAERVTVRAALALKVPDDLALVEAAALPEALATLWSTFTAARLAPGERLLVRGGSGGIGTVAVQLGRAPSARVLATAGGPARCARVRELGADVVVDHREPGLAAAVREATGGAGVDVVLDVLGAGGLAENLDVLADDGRLAVIGLQKGRRGEIDLGLLLAKRITVVAATLRGRPLAQQIAIMAEVREHAWPLVAAGEVRPVVDARLPLSEATEAHRRLSAGEVFGKLVLLP